MVVFGWLLTAFLGVMGLSKAIHSLTAMRWLWEHGRAYAAWMKKETPSVEERWTYFDHQIRVLPFGVNDYRLRRAAKKGSRLADAAVFVHRTDLLATVYFAMTLVLSTGPKPVFGEVWAGVGYLYLVVNLLISLESSLAFSQTGSYMTGYQWAVYDSRRTRRTIELGTFCRLLVRSLLVPTGIAAALVAWFEAIRGIEDWYDPFYYVLTTFVTVGYGDMTPANGWGKLLAILVMLQSATILAVVVSSVLSTGTD